MPKVLVTGAAGHLGSHLVPLLLDAGFEVTGLDLAAPAAAPAGWRLLQADLCDRPGVQAAVEGQDLVVHCASLHPWQPYADEQYLDANVKGTWLLYAAAAEAGVSHVVLTSSIAAAGYQAVPTTAWPVGEEQLFPPGDLYGLTKLAQEQIARLFADQGRVQTIALRPPAFMPRPDLETGFQLTGNFALVEDVAAAHLAAVRVLGGVQSAGEPLPPFQAITVTNALPYTPADAALLEEGNNVRRLAEKYWPDAYPWLVNQGYQGVGLYALYDLGRARRVLGWQPRHNFPEWYAAHAGP